MLHNKAILYFVLKLVVCYMLLSMPFPFLEEGYTRFYRTSCAKVFSSFADKGIVLFSDTEKPYIVQMDIGNLRQVDAKKNIKTIKAETNIRYRGFIPTILLLSLVMATPLFWRRKVFVFLSSFFLLNLFLMFKQWVHLIVLCTQNEWVQLYHFDAARKETLNFVYDNLITYMGPTFMVVILIWLLVSFKKEDFEGFSVG